MKKKKRLVFRRPHTLQEIERSAIQNKDNLEILEELKRMCVRYAHGPKAMKRNAQLAYMKIKGMIEQCQAATHQEKKATRSSTKDGSTEAVPADSSSTLVPTEADVGESSSQTMQ